MTETCPTCGAELNVDNAAGGLCARCLFERGIEFTSTLAINIADGSTPGSPRFTAPDPVEVEADLLSFDVLELVGQGGMGAVYKAYQRNLDRTVAIKILPRQSAGGHEFAERFAREARALARLRHDNIVMAYDYGLTDRYLYSVMEYVGGPNLRELLRSCEPAASQLLSPVGRGWERGETCDKSSDVDSSAMHPLPNPLPKGEGARPLAPRRALEIARDICAALQYAHDHGVVHRDIKPENVLLDEAGRVKIADFGLAKLLQPDPRELALTHTCHFMGTLHYMAPEQCERPHETDHRADIYSLGVVLYEMLTGELPIGRFDPPSLRANVDPRLDDLVLRALEKDPARRHESAAAFGEAISRELEAGVADNSSPPRGEAGRGALPQAARSRTHRGPLVAAGLLAFMFLAWFGWQLLIKYQRDKEGNTTLTVEAKGGEETGSAGGRSSSGAPSTRRNAVFETFKLKTLPATEAENAIRDRMPNSVGRIAVDERTNSLLIEANEDTLKQIKAILQELDEPISVESFRKLPPGEASAHLQRLETRIKNLADQFPHGHTTKLERSLLLLGESAEDSKEIRRKREELQRQMIEVESQRAFLEKMQDHAIRELDRLGRAYDWSRLGTAASQSSQGIVKGTQTSPGGETKIFSLRNSQAIEAYEMLRKLYSEDMVRMTAHQSTNQVIVQGDPEKLAEIEAILLRLDESGARKDGKNDPSATQSDTKPPAGRRRGSRTSSTQITPEDIKRQREQIETDVAALRERRRDAINQLNARTTSNTKQLDDQVFNLDRQIRMHENWLRELDDLSGPRVTIINPRHELRISVDGGFPDAPIDGLYKIDLDGYVNLGALYGKFKVIGLSADQAQAMILRRLEEILRTPKIVLSVEGGPSPIPSIKASRDEQFISPVRIQKDAHALRISVAGALPDARIDGLYKLDLDGYVNLGAQYGKIKVAGMTADEAQAAVLAELREVIREPKVTLTIEALNSKSPTETQESLLALEAQAKLFKDVLAKYKTLADQKEDEIFALTLEVSKSGEDASESTKKKLEALRQEKNQLAEQVANLEKEMQSLAARIQGLQTETAIPSATADPLANHPELVPMRRQLDELNAKIAQERHQQEGAKESAYLRALQSQAQRLQRAIQELEKSLRTDESHGAESPASAPTIPSSSHDHGDDHDSANVTRDDEVAIPRHVHIESGSTARREPRTEEMPLHIARAEAVPTLAVDFEMHGAVPRTIFVRSGNTEREIVVPYLLVVKGPHLGRKEFILPNWPGSRHSQNRRLFGTVRSPA
jgi:serine/threonine protein kinase/protein involved in polysaccharide export with SLBB domain